MYLEHGLLLEYWLWEKCCSVLEEGIYTYLLADPFVKVDKRAVWLGSFLSIIASRDSVV